MLIYIITFLIFRLQSVKLFDNWLYFFAHHKMSDFFSNALIDYIQDAYSGHLQSNQRLILSLNDIRKKNRELSKRILEEPISFIPLVEQDLNVRLSFVGSFGEYQHTTSSISSHYLGKMVKIEGIITSLSNIKPKLKKSVHEQDNKFFSREYRDATTITSFPLTTTAIPQKYQNKPLNFEYGLSTYLDTQIAVMQEMPENTKPGAMPRSINIILYDDLTDSVKPGDRVVLTGIYKTYCYNNINFPNYLPTALIVNHVENKNIRLMFKEKINQKEGQNSGVFVSESANEDLSDDQKQSGDAIPAINNPPITTSNALDYFASFLFISPAIKKALMLQMIGSENSVCRKSINILLLGDPSTAKSQLLRFVINVINAVSTSGKGSTGVGLTASVVSDRNERRLEAGAMVLADNSIICIDEFDKISYADLVVLHEVMEQQSISINKAGIHVTLNARTAVLAAANPIFGNFVDDALEKQIKISESLLSRFDLIFLVVDDGLFDSEIADCVLANHSSASSVMDDHIAEFRKFIFECKKYKPKMNKDSASLISDYYVNLRSQKTRFPVTPRVLDSLLRLSNANARFRQSDVIDETDVKEAIFLVEQCYTIHNSSPFKRMKVESGDFDSFGDGIVHEKSVSSGEVNGAMNLIKDIIAQFREENPSTSFLSLNDIASKCDLSLEDITKVLLELDAADVIMFRGETVIFLN